MSLPTYSTGTASVAAGGTVVTGVGGMWSGINAKQGDFISIGGSDAVLITEVTDTTHLKVAPWPAAAMTSQPYIIYQNYVGRVVGVAAAEDVGDMLEMLHVDGLPFIVSPDETVPDPSYGDDGQMAFKPSTGQWWTKTGGVWVSSPGLTSDASKVLKVGDTMTGLLRIRAADTVYALQLINDLTDKKKSLRTNSNASLAILNDADTSEILNLSDPGELTWTGTPWTAYTPTVAIIGGAGSATGYYKRLGKTLALKMNVTITTGGSNTQIGLPAGMVGGLAAQYLVGRENAVNGYTYVGYVAGSGVAQLYRYDNLSTVTPGLSIAVSGAIEVV